MCAGPPTAKHQQKWLHSRKLTNDNGKTTMNEDVSPIENGDFPLSC